MIPQEALDGTVEAMLRQLLNDEQACRELVLHRGEQMEQQMAQTAKRSKQVQAALLALAEQVQRLNRDYRSGHLSVTSYEENRRELDSERAEAREQLAYLTQLEASLAGQIQTDGPERQMCDLATRWDELEIPERKPSSRSTPCRVRGSNSACPQWLSDCLRCAKSG